MVKIGSLVAGYVQQLGKKADMQLKYSPDMQTSLNPVYNPFTTLHALLVQGGEGGRLKPRIAKEGVSSPEGGRG